MSGPTLTTVVLHFSPTVASLIRERLWHASQTLATLDDGWIRFIAQVAEPDEMRPWIRSWGAEVVVVEPPALRADIAAEAHRLSALYGGCPS
jgi:proteasome accessory factor B